MTSRRITVAGVITLGVGGLVTGAALWHAAGPAALLGGFGLLAFSPYAVLCGACFLADSGRGRAMVTLVVCAATAGAIYFYSRLIFIDPGSMSGLVFLLVPFYQLPVAILLLVVVFFSRPRRSSDATV